MQLMCRTAAPAAPMQQYRPWLKLHFVSTVCASGSCKTVGFARVAAFLLTRRLRVVA
jgi:hypothetical protein